jgi:NAD(P)-dependent dehydrogenase (short-subunit alcohol dehydrogenase family)
MTGRLDGKVCIVTGAAQGIGAAYARRLASEGAHIGIVDLSRIDQAGEVVRDIEARGRRAIAIRADVSDARQMEASTSWASCMPRTPWCRTCGSRAVGRLAPRLNGLGLHPHT